MLEGSIGIVMVVKGFLAYRRSSNAADERHHSAPDGWRL